MVFAAERNGTDCALDGVSVEFDAAIVQEATEGVPCVIPARQAMLSAIIADCISGLLPLQEPALMTATPPE